MREDEIGVEREEDEKLFLSLEEDNKTLIALLISTIKTLKSKSPS